MPIQRITTPKLMINDELMYISAYSLSYTDGLEKGEKTVKFKIFPTSTNINIIDRARDNLTENTIIIDFQDGSGETRKFTNMRLKNNPEYALSHDHDTEVVFNNDNNIGAY